MTLALIISGIVVILLIVITLLVDNRRFINALSWLLGEAGENTHKKSIIGNENLWRAMLFLVSVILMYRFVYISFFGIYKYSISEPSPGRLVLSVFYAYSWIAYMIMGACWAIKIRIGWFVPVTGTVAAVLSLLSINLLIVPLLIISPQFILAIWLAVVFVKFHLSKNLTDVDDTVGSM